VSGGKGNAGTIVGASILGGVTLFAYMILSIRLGIPFAIPVGIIGTVATAIILHGPVGKALIRRLADAPPPADETTGALLGEMDEIRQRVAELEERADFSERLLAQHSERARLAGGSDR
jgi:hypothetical protein